MQIFACCLYSEFHMLRQWSGNWQIIYLFILLNITLAGVLLHVGSWWEVPIYCLGDFSYVPSLLSIFPPGINGLQSTAYKAEVTIADNQEKKAYVGVTANTFKDRYWNHMKSLKNRNYANETKCQNLFVI